MIFKLNFNQLLFFAILIIVSSCKSIKSPGTNLIKIEESYGSKFFHSEEVLVEEGLREYIFNQEGKLVGLFYLNQDENGNSLEMIWSKIEKSMEYDDFGKIINIKTYGYNSAEDKALLKSIKLEYNSEGEGIHKLVRENYQSNKRRTFRIILEENKINVESQDSSLIESYTLNGNNKVVNYVRKHKINDNFIIDEDFKVYSENTIKVSYGNNYSEDILNFNGDGDLIEMLGYDKDQLISESDFRYQNGFIKKIGIKNYPGYLTSKNEEPLEVVRGKSYFKYELIANEELKNQDKLIDEITGQILGMRFSQYPKTDLLFMIMFFKS